MDATFSWRRTHASDLAECLRLHPAKNGAEFTVASRVLPAWRKLLEMTHATRSAVVEARGRGRSEIVGFGLATFVKKNFAEEEIRNPRPGLNARIIESVASGSSVAATYAEVRDANTTSDLQQVILDTSWKNGSLPPEDVDQVRVMLARSYQELFAGYRFSRILWETVDEIDAWHVRGHKSLRVVDTFDGFRRAHPKAKCHPDRALHEITTKSMRDDPHSVAAGLFQHVAPPQFSFTREQQELLELAVDGAEDAAMAQALHVTFPAIKRRWSGIFQRVGATRPELCPLDGEGTRGVQKRQRILAYVRSHPEELRPFDAKSLH